MANERLIFDLLTGQDNLTPKIRNAKKEAGFLKQAFTTAAGVFGGGLALKGLDKGVDAVRSLSSALLGTVKTAASLETVQNQFITLTGSASKARQVIGELQDFTATTPFQFPGVADAARRLISFGFETQNLVPILRNLGDVAAGSGSDLGELSLIFGQVRAAGKLTGERLLQFQERAIPIGPAIAKTLGVAEGAVRSLVSRGAVDFETFQKAFQSLNQEGGIFFQSTIRQSKTLEGVISTLSDNFDLLKTDVGQALLPVAKAIGSELIVAIQSLREQINNGKIDIQGFVDGGINILLTSIQSVSTAFSFVNNAIVSTQNFFDDLSGTIFSIVGDFNEFLLSVNQLRQGFANLTGIESKAFTESLANQEQELKGNIANANEAIRLIEETKNARIKAAQQQNSAVKTFVDESISVIKRGIDAAKSAPQEEVDAFRQAQSEKISIAQENAGTLLEIQKIKQEEEALLREEERILKEEEEIEDSNRRLERLQEINDRERNIQKLNDAEKLTQEGRVQEGLQKLREIEIDKLRKENDKKKELEQKRLQDRKTFLSTATTLAQSENRTLAAIGKAAAITQIAIDTPPAVASSFKFGAKIGGPPLGFVFGAIAATAMAAQAARVAGIQGFAQGGIVRPEPGVPRTGDQTIVGVNPGELILSRAQQNALVQNGGFGASSDNEVLMAMLSQPIVIQVNEREIFRAVRSEIRNGAVLA